MLAGKMECRPKTVMANHRDQLHAYQNTHADLEDHLSVTESESKVTTFDYDSGVYSDDSPVLENRFVVDDNNDCDSVVNCDKEQSVIDSGEGEFLWDDSCLGELWTMEEKSSSWTSISAECDCVRDGDPVRCSPSYEFSDWHHCLKYKGCDQYMSRTSESLLQDLMGSLQKCSTLHPMR